MGGHHEGIRIHYVFRRICIIGTVIKSPVEGHGNRIADCVQKLESDSILPIALSQYSCTEAFNRILVHYQKVIHLASYEYFLIYLSVVIFHTIFYKCFWFNKLL